jgi:hypothetical protein
MWLGGLKETTKNLLRTAVFPHIPAAAAAAAEDTSVFLPYFSKSKRYSVLSLYYNTDRIAVTIQLSQEHSYHDPTVVTTSLLTHPYFCHNTPVVTIPLLPRSKCLSYEGSNETVSLLGLKPMHFIERLTNFKGLFLQEEYRLSLPHSFFYRNRLGETDRNM